MRLPETVWVTMKRKSYTDEFRASAVLMLEAAGYPGTEGALMRVSSHLCVPHPTLIRWFRGSQNPPPYELVQEKRTDFIQQLQAIKGIAAEKIVERIEDFEPRDLTGLLKISAELHQLLTGGPTQNVNITWEQLVKQAIDSQPNRLEDPYA